MWIRLPNDILKDIFGKRIEFHQEMDPSDV